MRMLDNNLAFHEDTVISVDTENPFFPKENLLVPSRCKTFRSDFDATTMAIVMNFGSAKSVDSFVVLFSMIKELGFSGSEVIKLQGHTSNVWTSPDIDVTLTLNEQRRMASHYFSSVQTKQYWRLLITDASHNYNYLEVGTMIIGQSSSIPNAQNGFTWENADPSDNQRNKFSNQYSDKYPKSRQLNLGYNTLTIEEIEILEDIYDEHGSTEPIFFTLDHTSTLFDKDRNSIYGTLQKSFNETHVNYDILNTNGFSITEVF